MTTARLQQAKKDVQNAPISNVQALRSFDFLWKYKPKLTNTSISDCSNYLKNHRWTGNFFMKT
jgi:hypothetical protein